MLQIFKLITGLETNHRNMDFGIHKWRKANTPSFQLIKSLRIYYIFYFFTIFTIESITYHLHTPALKALQKW